MVVCDSVVAEIPLVAQLERTGDAVRQDSQVLNLGPRSFRQIHDSFQHICRRLILTVVHKDFAARRYRSDKLRAIGQL